jgi:predicted nucleic acid-binding protein
MIDKAIFIDTNILIYSNLALSPFHTQAIQKLQDFADQDMEMWISRQTLREYLSGMTRRSDLTGTIPITSLVADVEYFSSYFHVAENTALVTERLLKLMTEINIGGKQVHDANIVATMLVYGIPRLLTHNIGDFARFSELITILPLENED